MKPYGYVVRGQTTYSVPFLPQNAVPDIIRGNRCPVECSERVKQKQSFCQENWVLCVLGAFVIGALLFGD
jgi:hypothetical protein